MSTGRIRRVPTRAIREATSGFHRVESGLLPRFTVMMYHRVGRSIRDPWSMAIEPDVFRRHVEAMVGSGTVVSLSEAAARRRTVDRRVRRRWAITFDDGYVCNLRAALPILEEFQVPATCFIPSAFLGSDAFWWDELADIVDRPEVRLADLAPELARAFGAPLPQTTDRNELYHAAWRRLVGLDLAAIEECLQQLRPLVEYDDVSRERRPMTVDEVVELGRHPLVEIGGHTRTHPRLSRIAPDQCVAEIEQNRTDLADLLGALPPLFAYPYGDTSATAQRAVRDAGYSHAFTTAGRDRSVLDGPHALPRVSSGRTSPVDLAATSA